MVSFITQILVDMKGITFMLIHDNSTSTRCVVWTGDSRVFFYNPSTKTSLWECPPELKNRPEIAELTKEPPKEKEPNQTTKRSAESQPKGQEEVSKKAKYCDLLLLMCIVRLNLARFY